MKFSKPKGVKIDGTPYSTQISAKADREITEDGDSTHLKTYAAHIKLDYPCPSPKTATTRMIGDEFVWYRLFQTKGRGNAVVQAANWFNDLRYKGGMGKVLQGKETHECVVVDDPWDECSYATEFNPIRPLNRLLDEETKKRVIEESKGNLKFADKPFEKGQSYPSLEWVKGAKKRNTEPIKIGVVAYSNPSAYEMKDAIDNAVERARERKRNNQMPLMEELKTEDARVMVRKMRQSGLITRDETKIPWKSNTLLKRCLDAGMGKEVERLKEEKDAKWILAEETKFLNRRKKQKVKSLKYILR